MSENATPRTETRDGNWLDEFGCCKLCDGEIPHGHSEDCHLYKLEQNLSAANARIAELEKDAERYLDAIFGMADDGWLQHGEEGMSPLQEAVYKIATEHPEYKRRAAMSAKEKP